MNSKDKNLVQVCITLEEQALDVLRNHKYDNLPIETRTLLYEEKRRAVKTIRSKFSHLKSEIGHVRHEYDERGHLEAHKLFDRFSSHLPRYMH